MSNPATMSKDERCEAVAVELMGWAVESDCFRERLGPDPEIPGQSFYLEHDKDYFLTGDGMLQVLDEIDRRGWLFVIGVDGIRISEGSNGKYWFIEHEYDWDELGEKPSDYLPTAVLTAALQAVRASKDS